MRKLEEKMMDMRLPLPKQRLAGARAIREMANRIGHTQFADAMELGMERIEKEMLPRPEKGEQKHKRKRKKRPHSNHGNVDVVGEGDGIVEIGDALEGQHEGPGEDQAPGEHETDNDGNGEVPAKRKHRKVKRKRHHHARPRSASPGPSGTQLHAREGAPPPKDHILHAEGHQQSPFQVLEILTRKKSKKGKKPEEPSKTSNKPSFSIRKGLGTYVRDVMEYELQKEVERRVEERLSNTPTGGQASREPMSSGRRATTSALNEGQVHWREVRAREQGQEDVLHSRGASPIPPNINPFGDEAEVQVPEPHADMDVARQNRQAVLPVEGERVYRVNTEAAAARWGDPIKAAQERRKMSEKK